MHRGTLADLEEGGAATMLLSGRLSLQKDFRARRLSGGELAAAGPLGAAGAVALELIPVRETAPFEMLILSVDPERLLIRRLTLVDALGDRMVFEFHDLEEDPPLSDDLFRFEIPQGVDVIDNR